MILALRTDSADSEIYALDQDGQILKQKIWSAGRTLARDLLGEIETILDNDFSKLTGIIVFGGPGSFTGLRIGITVANALAYSEKVPVVGANGEDWIEHGVGKLAGDVNEKIVLPEYGAPANITKPTK